MSHTRYALLVAAALAALALSLTACFRDQRPVTVPFPDDPRVLSGSWDVRVLSLTDPVESFEYAEAAERLVLTYWGRLELYGPSEDGGWNQLELRHLEGALGDYDRTLEAFVAITSTDPLRVRVTPVAGATYDLTLPRPEGAALEGVLVGSGRVFAYRPTADTAYELLWWDAVTGDAGGPVPVRHPRHGLRLSPNGRSLASWDLLSSRVLVYDATAPGEQPIPVQLGACRSSGLSLASDDGKWFVFQDCRGNLFAADLHAPEVAPVQLGMKSQPSIRFAAGSHELVWVGQDGQVIGFDLATGSRTALTEPAVAMAPDDSVWSCLAPVYANRALDLLIVMTDRGTTRTLAFSLPTVPVEVPSLPDVLAELELVPEELTSAQNTYSFGGTLTFSGGATAGEHLLVGGRVHASNFHDYVPRLDTAMSPAPSLEGLIEVTDGVSDEPLHTIRFRASDRGATAYEGTFHSAAGDAMYHVMLERPGP